MSALQPITVYRQLLRSAATAFKGDAAMLAAARQEIRGQFEASRQVADPQQQQQMLAEGLEAAEFIRTQIVQAAVNDRGNYEMAISPEHQGSLVEPVQPGMKLPREKRRKPEQ